MSHYTVQGQDCHGRIACRSLQGVMLIGGNSSMQECIRHTMVWLLYPTSMNLTSAPSIFSSSASE